MRELKEGPSLTSIVQMAETTGELQRWRGNLEVRSYRWIWYSMHCQ